MDSLAAECALLPGDVIYVRGANTRRAAVAEVLEVSVGLAVTVRVRLITGWCAWEGDAPNWTDCSGAQLCVKPRDLEEIRE